MNAKDQQKVIRAGFILVRPDDLPSPRIKIKDGKSHEWRTMKKFETKAARNREMEKLLGFELVIQD
ncbi:hypothetical protein EZS27_006062 [termite gut metagenome]|uniref:Uncharacterized protein n=1 Tax=termite gut metagenome TaxID=433724 RepID=A0A5J4SKS5_9ZZZZ